MISLTDFLHKVIKWLATISLATMMIVTFMDLNLRYFFNKPILGSNEMTEFLLGTVVMSGLVIVSGERSHIAVTLFEPFLQRKIPVIYKWLGILVNLIGILAVTFLITHYTLFMRTQGNETEIREWQWWWLGTLLSTLCFFAVLMAVRSIRSPLENSMAAEDEAKLNGRGVTND